MQCKKIGCTNTATHTVQLINGYRAHGCLRHARELLERETNAMMWTGVTPSRKA